MKIGIIGSGIAGLAATWLLDNDCQVTLFEQRDRIGGHANTVYVDVNGNPAPIEIGFEFFNQAMFPYFFKLLNILNIQVSSYPFSYTFFTPEDKTAFVLPPIKDNKILWNSFFPSRFFKMLEFKYLISKSLKMLNLEDTSLTLNEFLNSLWLSNSFKNEFFFPLICAGWGVKPEDFKTFSAYNILSWVVKNKSMGMRGSIWSEVTNGVSAYINAMFNQISRAEIKINEPALEITYKQNKYLVKDSKGITSDFDHLIIATNAYQARKLLRNIQTADEVCSILSNVDYIYATLAVHNDRRFMPKRESDWSVANVCYNGTDSALTVYKEWKSGTPLFRSWLFPTFPKPEKIYALEYYYHAKPNANYFMVQNSLEHFQGKNNLWFAGIYTHDIDSHESALVSALKIAKNLAPNSQRLLALIN